MTEKPTAHGPFHVVDDSGKSDGAWLYVAPDVYGLTVYVWRQEPGDPLEVFTADATLHVDAFDDRVRTQDWDSHTPHDDCYDRIERLTNEANAAATYDERMLRDMASDDKASDALRVTRFALRAARVALTHGSPTAASDLADDAVRLATDIDPACRARLLDWVLDRIERACAPIERDRWVEVDA